MNKITRRYWRNSMRLRNWDYGSEGAYFITICTLQREHFFGEISHGKMHLNEAGKIAEQVWLLIPEQFSYVRIGSFVIMPNHVHGILIINKSLVSEDSDAVPVGLLAGEKGQISPSLVAARLIAPPPEPRSHQSPPETGSEFRMSSLKGSSLLSPGVMKPRTGGFAGELNPMLNDNISRVIRWYKGRCSFEIRKIQRDFKWQSKFHDHIIRNEVSYYCIEMYIEENPRKWSADELKRSR